MVRVLTFLVSVALIVGVLSGQWLAMFAGLPTLPHAPLHDCADHECGCPAELTARQACCCFPDPTKPASPPDRLETVIREVQCTGPQNGAALFTGLFLGVLVEPLQLELVPAQFRRNVFSYETYSSEVFPPPDPPPPAV